MPKIDQGQFVMKVNMLPGTKLSITDSIVKKVEKLLLSDEDVSEVTVTIGSSKERARGEALETLGAHQAQVMVNLNKGRESSTNDFIQRLKTRLSDMNLLGVEIQYILQESALKTAFESSAPVVLEVKGPDLDELRILTDNIQLNLRKINGLYGIKNNLAEPSPETKIWISKDRASTYGLLVKDIAATAQVALKGYIATKFKEEGKEIDVRVRLRPYDRKDISMIGNILLTSPMGMQVPLKEVAYIGIGKGPSEIRRLNQQRTVLVSANVYKRSLNEVQDEISSVLKKVNIPKGYTVALTGEAQKMKESFHSLIFALILSVVLVYMIMAAQFESFWQPFLIMLTIPLSLIGITWTLFFTDTSLSVVVLLGIIMQGGIVVNNGIILIDYANVLRSRGKELYDATIRAGKTRLRPIMMTAFTSILALFPLALGLSEGSELDAPLAKTTMGGLFSSTFFTLLIVPALYFASTKLIEKIFKRKKKIEPPAEEEKPIEPEPPKEEEPELPEPKIIIPPEEEKPAEFAIRLNKRQRRIIEYLKQSGNITRKDLAKFFKISVPTAARDLKKLSDIGLIVGIGPLAVGRYYELTQKGKDYQP